MDAEDAGKIIKHMERPRLCVLNGAANKLLENPYHNYCKYPLCHREMSISGGDWEGEGLWLLPFLLNTARSTRNLTFCKHLECRWQLCHRTVPPVFERQKGIRINSISIRSHCRLYLLIAKAKVIEWEDHFRFSMQMRESEKRFIR